MSLTSNCPGTIINYLWTKVAKAKYESSTLWPAQVRPPKRWAIKWRVHRFAFSFQITLYWYSISSHHGITTNALAVRKRREPPDARPDMRGREQPTGVATVCKKTSKKRSQLRRHVTRSHITKQEGVKIPSASEFTETLNVEVDLFSHDPRALYVGTGMWEMWSHGMWEMWSHIAGRSDILNENSSGFKSIACIESCLQLLFFLIKIVYWWIPIEKVALNDNYRRTIFLAQ